MDLTKVKDQGKWLSSFDLMYGVLVGYSILELLANKVMRLRKVN